MAVYYNEIDPKCASWLRELIKHRLIASGDVDERSIEDVRPDDLRGYKQCHFFAGIGVWSYALRRSGWVDDRPVWTGSCPCQPFSAAGKGKGFADERHLWPAFFHLIRECRPVTVFGEQVASKDGLAWLDLVQTDLEATDYAVGAVDTCAAGFGAPHIRQRLYWVAYAQSIRQSTGELGEQASTQPSALSRRSKLYEGGWRNDNGYGGQNGGMADSVCEGLQGHGRLIKEPIQERREGAEGHSAESCGVVRPSSTNGFWANPDWLFCRDGKWRPVESGTFPLAHGASARVGRLRGYGNALNEAQAEGFIKSFMELSL